MSKYSNSNLVSYTNISPNKTVNRNQPISRITPHCIVGMWTAKKGCDYFANDKVDASANYIIGKDGDIGLGVEEKDRAWTSSSSDNDNKAITVEIASQTYTPYEMTEKSIDSFVELSIDICKRNGKNKVLWFNDKEKSLSYQPKNNEIIITIHKWFKNKSCPGDWMIGQMDSIVARINKGLGIKEDTVEEVKPSYETKLKLKDGDEITLKPGSKYTSGKDIPGWVFKSKLYFRGTNSKGIIFSTQKTGAITGVINESALVLKEDKVESNNYKVRVIVDALNVREGPGTNYKINTVIRDKGIYRIVDTKGKWLKLFSGAGWIHGDYVKKL